MIKSYNHPLEVIFLVVCAHHCLRMWMDMHVVCCLGWMVQFLFIVLCVCVWYLTTRIFLLMY